MSNISITFWNRLEPRPRGRSLRRSLAAEVRDPLWLLTRQWQLGEFQGEDAGSPQGVVVETETFALTEWQARGGGGAVDDSSPLEVQMGEPYVPDLSMRVELAQVFLQFLDDESKALDFLDAEAYRLLSLAEDDPATARRMSSFMADRLFDGYLLYRDITTGAPYPLKGELDAVAERFKRWVEDTYSGLGLADDVPDTDFASKQRDPRTWHAERLEHRAVVSAEDSSGGVIALSAQPTGGGELDWDSFDLVSTTAGDPATPPITQLTEIQPTHVRFPGMPNARFWDFEEGTMSFAEVEPDTRDLARMMLVEFALVQGADWFYFDLPQPVGTLCRIHSLVVKDVFGTETLVERAASGAGPRWALFQASRVPDAPADTSPLGDFLFIPPSSAAVQQRARPLEDVLFARDEMANMAWAVERATPGPIGDPWPGHERDAARPTPPRPEPDANAPPLTYEIMSRVPIHWTPLLPARVSSVGPVTRPQVALLAGKVVRDPEVPDAIRGKILRPDIVADGGTYVLHEEEVPRAGVQVRRLMVRSRWKDGASHLWFARVRAAGRGETGSGLRFDRANETRR